ncbi:hypothetical protein UA75_29005 [Actinoalloteichus sp. GBA129-24]|uniref:Uncharacterized protein n=1 Tax=Actinoalloteichus fjordicus TaxID=1612552 RepID=A0AAC9LJ19_9PSEU|nr:hypothetical protein UA74_28475 [Actinoalloteichus fjordicus]APU23772.1 hypothetical protein UA75_29005 [Actinoalloteichus sp. GBA129-24]
MASPVVTARARAESMTSLFQAFAVIDAGPASSTDGRPDPRDGGLRRESDAGDAGAFLPGHRSVSAPSGTKSRSEVEHSFDFSACPSWRVC